MHDDQFTATGPAFTGAGFARAAFSTGRAGTDSTYGVNVQGSFCGVYGESTSAPDRNADVEGVGVFGVGQNFGLFGKGSPNGGIAGVFGQHNRGGVAIFGAAMRGGTGVVGASVGALGNPLNTLAGMGDPADGSGTGVFGTSGDGAGVRGSSKGGNGVLGTSQESDGVVGGSDAAVKSGVFGFHTLGEGAAFGVSGTTASRDGVGVNGFSTLGIGVRGASESNDGVVGSSALEGKSGVFGFNLKTTAAAFGVSGHSNSPDGAGVNGSSGPGIGVRGTSATHDGVVGLSAIDRRSGVFGFNVAPTGAAYGVTGSADSAAGAGVRGISDHGYGGDFRGGRAPLRLVPAATAGAPTTGNHQRGEFFVDSDGDLFYCKDGGTPGTWFRVRLVAA